MPILYNDKEKTFHLFNESISYIFGLSLGKYPEHVYFGRRVADAKKRPLPYNDNLRPLTICLAGEAEKLSLHHLPHEYPAYGNSDFHYPAFSCRREDGSGIFLPVYSSHRIYSGKKKLEGLPSLYAETDSEADSLDIAFADSASGLELVLSYTIYKERPVITRSILFRNGGRETVDLARAMSFSLDFHDSAWDMLHLSGSWARERSIKQTRLSEGVHSIHSMYGISSDAHNPFFALKRETAGEDWGDVYGFSLIYSGNFLAQAEIDSFGHTRVMMGIHPDTFNWPIEPGCAFQTPEAVLVHTSSGLSSMSQIFHALFRERLVRGQWRDKDRPVLLNNWEATGCAFTSKEILSMADNAKELGIELFVLDDGWFKNRNSDTAGLGDWYPDPEKIPEGLVQFADSISKKGLLFGLWIEPEMVNEDSDLYRNHPDWILRTAHYSPSTGRNQYVLDFSRPEIVDHIAGMLERIFAEVRISYVKWDMNRYLSDCWSSALASNRQGTVFHKYVLGVYTLYERLTSRFPHILFESCSSGGARFDPGILAYAPQTWTSDDTDAVERMKIQQGTSLVYPLSCMGNHVSVVPNQQVGRIVSLETRGNVAFFGQLGYELDPAELTAEEKELVRKQICRYREYRQLVRTGLFYRLSDALSNNCSNWLVVNPEKTLAIAGIFRILNQPNQADSFIALKGLDPAAEYTVSPGNGSVYHGDELMYAGYRIQKEYWSNPGDFASMLLIVEKKK